MHMSDNGSILAARSALYTAATTTSVPSYSSLIMVALQLLQPVTEQALEVVMA